MPSSRTLEHAFLSVAPSGTRKMLENRTGFKSSREFENMAFEWILHDTIITFYFRAQASAVVMAFFQPIHITVKINYKKESVKGMEDTSQRILDP
jgi:hypothetical protein